MKLHHAVSDGVGLVRMTESMVERSREAVADLGPLPAAPQAPDHSLLDRTREAFVHGSRTSARRVFGTLSAVGRSAARAVRAPLTEGRRIADAVASIRRVLMPASAPESPIMTERSLGVHFDTVTVSLEELKRAGRAVGGTVNDAFVAGVAGGLQHYHESLGAPVASLRMQMPVNMREGERGNQAGNQFAPARFLVPTQIKDPAERVRRIGALVREQRAEPALPLMEEISGALSGLPTAAIAGLFGGLMRATDFTTSNVRGPRYSTYVSGARVEAILPFGPLAGVAANVTAFSYAGQLSIGINTDPAAVSDPQLLLECLEKSFEEVLTVV
jgi:WS/DGAT/MGAT family acyltransferase